MRRNKNTYRVDYVTSRYNKILKCAIENHGYAYVATREQGREVIRDLKANKEISLIRHSIVTVTA